jgi:hypothetical protein
MPELYAVKPASLRDGLTLRKASSLDYKGSTTGSFVGHPGSFDGLSRVSTDEALIEREAPSLPMTGCYRYGYLLQYFAVGFIYGGLPATTYGFLKGYLGVS